MRTSVRLYRTADGELVNEGHADAVALAYGQDDEVESADQAAASKLQPKTKPADDHEPKAEAKPTPKRHTRKRAAANPE